MKSDLSYIGSANSDLWSHPPPLFLVLFGRIEQKDALAPLSLLICSLEQYDRDSGRQTLVLPVSFADVNFNAQDILPWCVDWTLVPALL